MMKTALKQQTGNHYQRESMPPFSILVVDDEPVNFNVIEALLSVEQVSPIAHRGCQLHYVTDGEAALSTLEVCKPDLILLDIMMPGMDGIEVCQHIRAMKQWETVPIVVVTAITTRSELARCLSAGANDFINKPIGAVELRARVHSMLKFKQQYDRLQTLCQVQRQTIHELEQTLHSSQ